MAEFDRTSAFFTAFRKDYGFPYFHRDEPLYLFRTIGLWGVGLAYIVTVLSMTILITFLGTRGYSRWRIALQMIVSLVIGLPIVMCAVGQSWQKANYEMRDGANIKHVYGLYIGLRQANITMETYDRVLEANTEQEWKQTAYYNEKIEWIEVDQAEKEYREALLAGWPWEILRITRYISIDMGGLRYMRAFRKSGYSVYIILWSAFATWLLSNILLKSAISYGGWMLFITGVLQILACIVYDTEQPSDFFIPLDHTIEVHGNMEGKLKLKYYWMYWLILFVGIFTVLLSIIILVLNYIRPEDTNKFFGTVSEYHSPYEELEENQNKSVTQLGHNLSKRMSRLSRKNRSEGIRQRLSVPEQGKSYQATAESRGDEMHGSLNMPVLNPDREDRNHTRSETAPEIHQQDYKLAVISDDGVNTAPKPLDTHIDSSHSQSDMNEQLIHAASDNKSDTARADNSAFIADETSATSNGKSGATA